ncbi:MAG: PilZ domain-containing protein [Bdellovibrionales bacterium]
MTDSAQPWIFFNVKDQRQTEAMPQPHALIFILRLKPHELKNFVIWTPGWEKWRPLKEVLREHPDLFPLPPPFNLEDTSAGQQIKSRSEKRVSDEKTPGPPRVRQKTVTDPGSTQAIGEHTYTEINLSTSAPAAAREFDGDAVKWDKTLSAPVLGSTSSSKKAQVDQDDERREFKRFPHRIEVVLMTRMGRSFRSSSQNISLGGALLRDPVPEALLKDVMDLVVVNPFPDKETPSHLLLKGRIVPDTNDRRRLMFYDVSPEVQKKLQLILENYKRNYAQFKKNKKAAA